LVHGSADRQTSDGEFAFSDRFCCVSQGFTDVIKLEIRILVQNLGLRHPFAHRTDDRGNRNAQSADAWDSPHLLGPRSDSFQHCHFDLRFTAAAKVSTSAHLSALPPDNCIRLCFFKAAAAVKPAGPRHVGDHAKTYFSENRTPWTCAKKTE
jgi:hypothetical protein